MINKENDKNKVCAFCGKSNGLVIAHEKSSAAICEDCLKLSTQAYRSRKQATIFRSSKTGQITPQGIISYLDQFVIGQDSAKRALAVAAYNHFTLLKFNEDILMKKSNITIDKSNILIIGPTGSGKTLIAKVMAQYLNVPLIIFDATSLTEAGYVGQDVESILYRLICSANGDIEKAQKGIVFLDEIDKLSKKSSGIGARDISGEGVQQGLLKLLEGSLISVPMQKGKKVNLQEEVFFDTSQVLFICAGTFVGLEEIAKLRLRQNSSIGFGEKNKEIKPQDVSIDTSDVVSFGMLPELVGRLSVIAKLHDLDEQMMVRILQEPKNSLIKQYQCLLDMSNAKISFSEDALLEIAKEAQKKKVGVRGLRLVMEDLLLDVMYEAPIHASTGLEIRINAQTVHTKQPIIVKKRKKVAQ